MTFTVQNYVGVRIFVYGDLEVKDSKVSWFISRY